MTATMPKTQRGPLNVRKALIASAITLLAVLLIVGGLLLLRRTPGEVIVDLDQVQNDLVQELIDRQGEYDERSIVLTGTNKATAKKLAEKLGADLRITSDGSFATLSLPEGVTFLDIAQAEEYLSDLPKMSIDYEARISEVVEEEETGSAERLPMRPQYTVTDGSYELQTYLDYLNMKNLWLYTKGYGVTVAVIDTGIDTDHPEFAGRISEYSYNATEDKIVKDWLLEDGSYDWSLIEDEQGHGTSVAGVIGASMNSGEIVGIAPEVTLLVIKAECDANGSFKRTSDLVFGLYYAIERDVSVVNMSFGIYSQTNPFAEPAQLAFDSDIICVAAAGNDATTVLAYPAADKNVIGVGALGDGWTLAEYSNYGENSDLVAPGGTYTTKIGGGYGFTQGTSLAAPIVSGAIALYRQYNPYSTFDEVTEVLYASCYDLGGLGNDWEYGFGALDLSAFLIEERGTVTFDMLTDELDNTHALFIRGHALQDLPEPERLYAVFDGWYYDYTFTEEVNYYTDEFEGDLTLYAKWVNEDDGIPYTYVVLDDGTVEIRSYTGHRRYITIPEKIEGKTVSSIGDFALSGQERLREVTLPSGLKNIGISAFENCSNLLSIEIPEGVTFIGEYAFANNTRLASIAFLGNSKITTIDKLAFSSCGMLERLDLPASLTTFDGSVVAGCISLRALNVQSGNQCFQSVDGVMFDISKNTLVAYPAARSTNYKIPVSTQHIGAYAFAYCRLTGIDFSEITTIGEYAFSYSMLETVSMPNTIIFMGENAFFCCANLSQVTLSRGLEYISKDSFARCISLINITVPNSIQSIGPGAFSCSGIAQVIFETNSILEIIDNGAFGTSQIREITIPASVTTIGAGAFAWPEGFYLSNPLQSVNFEKGSRLVEIGQGAFSASGQLKNIDLPNKLEILGAFAFKKSGLEEITVPASVTMFGEGAFALCTDLPYIKVEKGNKVYHDIDGIVYNLANTELYAYPSGKESYGYTLEPTTQKIMNWGFAGAEYLVTIYFPESLIQICEYSFSYCSSLEYLQIPDNVLQIGRYSFAYSPKLSSINFSPTAQIPRLSYAAFAYSGLYSFTVPASVSTIAQDVFKGCSGMYSITFAENSKLESISAYMFDGCENLNTITFLPGSALTSIQAHGLEGMDNLANVDFGDAKLTDIDNFAFRFCESLSELKLPETLANIGRYAFYCCSSLSTLTVPEKVEHIGSYAFLGTKDIDIYFSCDILPAYLDENWDMGTKGYYVGVTSIQQSGDFKYATLSSGDVAIIEYLGNDTHIDLSVLDFGAPITAIGAAAFKDSSVISIVLPGTLTSIQAEAFQYTALESITIPSNVTFIGREAFAHTDIGTLNFKGTSKINVIEQYAFEGTKNLKSVTLPASLSTMGTGVFSESGLTSLVFESGIKLTEIPQAAFASTKLRQLSLPDSVTLVNHNAFNNVTTLQSVAFGQGENIRLMSNAFYHTGLTTLHIPTNISFIGEYCFVALPNLQEFTVDPNNPNYTACDGLLLTKSGRKLIAVPAGRAGSLTVPLSVEEIGFGAFEESNLSEILFHEDANILSFGYRAFFKAENITSITVPASVVSVDYYAFAYCKNLQTVIFAEDNQLKGIYEGAFLGDNNLVSIVIPDSIVEISDFAFYGCTKITKLPITESSAIRGIYDYAFAYSGLSGEFTTPEMLADIGSYAFLGTNVTKVTIPDTNKEQLIIGIGAFEDCIKLEEITLPFIGASYEDETISWFGYIFGAGSYEANGAYVPQNLKTVTLTEGITTIYKGGFAYCAGLEVINIPRTVCVLWDNAFKDTTAVHQFAGPVMTYYHWGDSVIAGVAEGHFGYGIEHISLEYGVLQINYNAFQNLTNLTSIVIPETITTIESDAFAFCSNLTSIHIPNSVSNIGGQTFWHCSNLVDIRLPDSISKIPNSMFGGCSSLTSIEIPDSVTEIGYQAFSGCTNLANVSIPDGVTTIGFRAFVDCKNLLYIQLPTSLKTIDYSAFERTGLIGITLPKNLEYIARDAFLRCNDLLEVINNSSLAIELGSTENGYVAYYAQKLVDKDGNTTCIDGANEFEYVDTSDGFRFIKENDKYTLIAYIGDSSTVTLPLNVKGNKYEIYQFRGATHVIIPEGVTAINDFAFEGSGITSVSFPRTLTTIGVGSFRSCFNLTNIDLPSGVTTIGDMAFGSCVNLRSVRLSDTLTTIGVAAFSSCTSLTEMDLPDSIETVGGQVFYNCTSLTNVKLPNNIRNLSFGLFYNCTALMNIDLPNSIDIIEWDVFTNCTSLANVKLPNNLVRIRESAFKNCPNLKSIKIPDSVSQIASDSFDVDVDIRFGNNKNFKLIDGIIYNSYVTEIIHVTAFTPKTVVIPDTVRFIGAGAFANRKNIVEIVLSDNISWIPNNAFMGCANLTNIVLPNGIISIGYNAFKDCTSLQSIILPDNITIINGSNFEGCINLINVKLPSKLTSIGMGAFKNCTSLTSIDLPDSVQSIGVEAFSGCSSLTNILLPNGITRIDIYAFRDCSGLTTIELPETITSLESLFAGCSNLTSVILPKNATTIPSEMFYGCSKLTSIDMPAGITSIGSSAFAGCTGLTSITLPDNITHIGTRAFEGCINLQNVYISDIASWCNIEFGFDAANPFYYAQTLYIDGEVAKEITIPDGVVEIKAYAFENCAFITKVILPDSVTKINMNAFSGCVSLKSIVFSENITSIGEYAFIGCSSLTDIDLPQKLVVISRAAFRECGLLSVAIPENVISIEDDAFYECKNLLAIYNNSSLNIVFESDNPGGCASRYAQVIVDKNGNKTWRDPDNKFEYVDTPDGFRFAKFGEEYRLIAYTGTKDTITLPTSINGKPYRLYYFSGGVNVIIPAGFTEINEFAFANSTSLENIYLPDGLTTIWHNAFWGCTGLTSVSLPDSITIIDGAFRDCAGLTEITLPDGIKNISGAFAGCKNLTSINLPESIENISGAFNGCVKLSRIELPAGLSDLGSYTFYGCSNLSSIRLPKGLIDVGEDVLYGTKIYDDPNNWTNGMLVIDGWIFDVKEDVKYLTNDENIKGAASDAFNGCYMLKNAINKLYGTTNVETLIITDIKNLERLYNTPTLKNIVILDTVQPGDLRYLEDKFTYYDLKNVTIFVEDNEEELRWDANFPGWHNGNIVIYGDKWIYSTFHDENGNILRADPLKTSQIIRLPIIELPESELYDYEFLGWDLDGDGIADSTPATSVVNISAMALVKSELKKFTVIFKDAESGKIYQEQILEYGSMVLPPDTPVREDGYLEKWNGYYEGMTIDRDIVITTVWHIHTRADAVVENRVEPGCTTDGHYDNVVYCSACHAELSRETITIGQPGHSNADAVVENQVEPDCTTDGHYDSVVYCSTCHAELSRETITIGMRGHTNANAVEEHRVEPGCTTDGHYDSVVYCSTCSAELYRETITIGQLGHTNVDAVVENREEPECTTDGHYDSVVYCSTCHVELSRETITIGQLGHSNADAVVENRVEPDCTTDGHYDSVVYCSTCHVELSRKTITIGQLGHSNADAVVENRVEATCTEDGHYDSVVYCLECNEELFRETIAIDALDHDHLTEWTIDVEPTCTSPGVKSHHCSRCEDKADVTEVPATDHTYDDDTDDTCNICNTKRELSDSQGCGAIMLSGIGLVMLMAYATSMILKKKNDLY